MNAHARWMSSAAMAAMAAMLTFPVAGHAQASTAAMAVPVGAGEMAEAEVRKVDKENRKITLKHGTIKSLDMPPMTMVFHVNDVQLLDKVKSGDKILFSAIDDDGKLKVTRIQPTR